MRGEEQALAAWAPTQGERAQVVTVGAAGLLCLGLFYALDPGSSRLFLDCPLHVRTGIFCAGCGGQRAIHELLHGRIGEALSQNILAVAFFVPLATYLYVTWALRVFLGTRLPVPQITLPRVMLFLAASLVYAVLRNLPEFAWLAPV